MFSSRATVQTWQLYHSRAVPRFFSSCASRLSRHASRERLDQANRVWNPTIRALLDKRMPTMLYEARSHTPRGAARLFIATSCFVMAGHCAVTFIDPPDGFSPLLRRFVGVVTFLIAGFGLLAVFRNAAAVKSILAVPVKATHPGSRALLLKVEATRHFPWQKKIFTVPTRHVSLSEPLRAHSISPKARFLHSSPVKTAFHLPLNIFLSQFKHVYDALRDILFLEDAYMVIEGQSGKFRLDGYPKFTIDDGARLNAVVGKVHF